MLMHSATDGSEGKLLDRLPTLLEMMRARCVECLRI